MFGGALERAQARLQLGAQVLQLHAVGVDLGQAALGLGALEPQGDDARGVLEEAAALLRPRAERGVDQPLPDDGVALPERRGERQHVAQAHAGAVEQVVRLAVAEDAASDGHLAELEGQRAAGVVEGEADLGHAERGAAAAAGEDDVLAALAAQGDVALLAERPAHRLAEVRLAAAVRPDDRGQAGREVEDGAGGEALEAVQLQALEVEAHRGDTGTSARRERGRAGATVAARPSASAATRRSSARASRVVAKPPRRSPALDTPPTGCVRAPISRSRGTCEWAW